MPAGPLVNNVIAPWGFGIYGMLNPGARDANKGDYPYNDYGVPDSGGLNIPGWLTSGQPAPTGGSLTAGTTSLRPRSATGGNPFFESWASGQSAIPAADSRAPLPVRPGGGGTGGTPRGPGGGTPSPGPGGGTPSPGPGGGGGTGSPLGTGGSGDLSMQDWYRMYQQNTLNRTLQARQSPEEQAARNWAINEFANSDNKFGNFFGNYALQPGESLQDFGKRSSWARARQYQMANLGGFNDQGQFVGGQNGPLYGELKRMIALQGLSPYSDPQSWGGAMIGINRQAVSDANAVAGMAPGEADKALAGAVGDRRNAFASPGAATGGFLNTIAPLNQLFSAQVGSPQSWVSGMNSAIDPFAGQRMGSANGAFDQAADAGFDLARQRDAGGWDPMSIAERGVTDTRNMRNAYEDDLMQAIDAESKRSLAQQTPEVAAQMAAAGYGESGAGQAAMGNLQSSILEQANRDKIRALTDFRQNALDRQAQAISQRTGVGAENAAGILNLSGDMYGRGFGAREDALNSIFNTQANAAQQAYLQGRGANQDMLSQQYNTTVGGGANLYAQQLGAQNQLEDSIFGTRANAISQMQRDAWGARNDTLRNTYDNTSRAIMGGLDADSQRRQQDMRLLSSGLFGSEDAQMRRVMSQLGINQGGLNMGSTLWDMGNQDEMQRLNLMLGLGRSNQDYEQQYLDQISNLMLMPYRTGLQMTTGINTSPVSSGYRVSPWAQMGAQVGGNVLGGMLGGGGGGGGGGAGLFAAGDWTEG